MRRLMSAFFMMSCLVAVSAPSRASVDYVIMIDPPKQMLNVDMVISDVNGSAVDVMLPTWRPGRYEILDMAGGVENVRAEDGGRNPLPIRKISKSSWRVTTNGASQVTVSYDVWANDIATRTRHVDDTHAFISPSSVLMYVEAHRDSPSDIDLIKPAEWTVATGLEPVAGMTSSFTAPNYDVLVDSPIEVGVHDVLRFDVDAVPHEIVIWGDADYDGKQLVEDFTAIVEHQRSIFGAFPYSRYVFMIHVDGGGGGGTEHLNSTIMQVRRSSLEDDSAYTRFLGLVSHEFFHTWNVKQLRPACIHPYDYQQENVCELFWVAEGTTSYYDDLTLARTGLITPDRYLGMLSSSIDRLRRRPGRKVQSLEMSSFDAWVKFNRRSAHSVNSTVSFYSKGALVSLLMDAHLRAATDNTVTMDDLMRVMYERFPLSGPGFTTDDLLVTARELSGRDFTTFHRQYIAGTDDLDFDSIIGTLGLEVVFDPSDEDWDSDDMPRRAYLGLDLGSDGGRTTVRAVRTDGPASAAGVMPGDEVLAMDGRRLTSGGLSDRLDGCSPGQTVELVLFRRDRLITMELDLGSEPDGSWVVQRMDDPSEAQIINYEDWMRQDWPRDDGDEDTSGAAE
ncbi:MAG: PDZ domain-containing protein [Planctomycetota bacterium]